MNAEDRVRERVFAKVPDARRSYPLSCEVAAAEFWITGLA